MSHLELSVPRCLMSRATDNAAAHDFWMISAAKRTRSAVPSAAAQMLGGNNYQLVCKSAKLPMELLHGRNFHAAQCQRDMWAKGVEWRCRTIHLGPQFLVLWQGFAWQFCANFLRLLFVYETSHVSDETRSLLLPFLGALNWQLAKWACHHLVFATITLPVVVVSPWGDCHWNREFSNWQTSRKRLKLFTIFRALLPDCWFGNLLF